ncbi:hypothetical protein V6N11_059545 [Hibiscus sabdariffa]|uniref:Uncharacterized protein n=2 Tax=Hibiscus sabdariffa TaxID=183260 RepID=A0ABR2AI29_9ROSI
MEMEMEMGMNKSDEERWAFETYACLPVPQIAKAEQMDGLTAIWGKCIYSREWVSAMWKMMDSSLPTFLRGVFHLELQFSTPSLLCFLFGIQSHTLI